MKLILKCLFAVLCGFGLAVLCLYGIDRHLASRENAEGLEAVDCIFQSNCDYYNSKMNGKFFRG